MRVPIFLGLFLASAAPLLAQPGDARLGALADSVEATHRDAPERAVVYGREALALRPQPALERDLLLRLGKAYDKLDDLDAMRDVTQRLEALGDPLARGHAALFTGRMLIEADDYDGAREALGRAVDRYTEAGGPGGRAMALYNLGTVARRLDRPEEARVVYERARQAYAAAGDSRGEGNSLLWLGLLALDGEDFPEAVRLFRLALSLREAEGIPARIAPVHYNLGKAFEQMGDYDRAFVHHTRAMELHEEAGDTAGVAGALNTLADLHEDHGDILKARAMYLRARDLYREAGQMGGVAATVNNIGTTHIALEEWDEAEAAFSEYLRLALQSENRTREGRAYQNLGVAFAGRGETERALDSYGRAVALFRAEGEQEPLADTYRHVSEARLAQGRPSEALAAADSSLAIASAILALPVVREAHLARSGALERLGRFEEALAAYREAEEAEDELFSAESRGVIAEVEERFRTREQRRQIEALEAQRQAQRWWLMALVGGLGLLLVIVALLWSRLRLRREALTATERARQLEADRAADLAEADALKSRFLANVTHEFRTPLTLTFGPIGDLLAGRFASLDEARPHFERARRNGQRLLRLVTQLLELSRLDAGTLRLDARRLDLARHVREIAALFDDVARARGLALHLDVPGEPLPHVADPDKIEQVVVNLLSNAVKFTKPGGTVSLALRRDDDGAARLVVRDTGVGIAPEHLARLFDRFYQVEGDATRGYEGAGIGLALVKELVTLHGGRVTVDSAPGEGARFEVVLPPLPETPEPTTDEPIAGLAPADPARLDDHPEPLAEAEAPEDADADEPVVLVVEDNPDLRAYIRAHLGEAYRVIEAPDGASGLGLAREWVPDLVVSDVMMPEMDGLAMTDALKTDRRTSHIPVLLLTARADVEDRIAGYEAGADAYLPKPFDAGELVARARALVDERRRLRARWSQAATEAEAEPVPALPPQEAAFLAELDAATEPRLGDAGFGVDQLAEAVGLSRRQLFRKVKGLTDETPAARLRRLRLERAAEVLRAGAAVGEARNAAGFQSESSFAKAFRAAFGVAPSEYAAQAPSEDG